MDLGEGALLAGKYRLLRRLGAGGMGEVWLAKVEGPAGFEKQVAIKIANPTLAADPEFVEMFLDEARLSAQLAHANIAQIHDLGHADDAYFIVMELVPGKDLRQTVFALRKTKQRFPVAAACFIVSELCQALDYAHRKRGPDGHELLIVHRDVSPPNCLLSMAGDVKLIDFGIARIASRASSTKLGMIKGKLGYMSPEQAAGQPLDRRSDVFALGVVLYELLSGVRLFQGDSDIETLEKVRNPQIPELNAHDAQIPVALEAVVRKALSRERQHRQAWASDLHAELQPFLVTRGVPFGRTRLAGLMGELFAADASPSAEAAPARTPARATPVPRPSRPTVPVQKVEEPPPLDKTVSKVLPAGRVGGRKRWLALIVLFLVGGLIGAVIVAQPRAAPEAGVDAPPVAAPVIEAPVVVAPVVAAPVVAAPVVAAPVVAAPVVAAPVVAAPVVAAPAITPPPARRPVAPVERPPKPTAPVSTEFGELTIQSNEPADVMLDGKRIGSAPMARERVRSGEHTLRIDCILADGRHEGTPRTVEIFPYSEVTVTNNCKVAKTITR